MKKILMMAALCLLAQAAFAQKEYGLTFSSLVNDNLTLENAIRLGLENNSKFLAAKQEIIIAEQKVTEAKFRYLPQFSLQGTATWYDLDYPMVLPDAVANRFLPGNGYYGDKDQFYGVGITATQYLYSGGRIRSTLRFAQANLKQVQSRYESVKNAVVLDIKKSFAALLYAQQNAQLTQRIWKLAQKWNASANSNLWAKMRMQNALFQLQSAQKQAENNLKQANLAMLVSLNKELNARVTIRGEFSPVKTDWDLPHLTLWAMEFRPELKAAIYALETDDIAIDLALSRRYPDVILNASYEKLGANTLEDQNRQISLAVRLPISYNFSTQVTEKKAQQQKSSLSRAAIEDTIRVQVAENFEKMSFWQQEVLDRQTAYREMDVLLKQAPRQPQHGAEALEALQAYLQTAQRYLQAVKENQFAKAELEWAIGQDLQ